MSSLTGLLYGGLVVYLGGWYFGKWTGNFSLLLLILTLVTLAYWVAERFVFAPKRVAAAQTLEQHDAMRRQELSRRGIAKVDGDVSQANEAGQHLFRARLEDGTRALYRLDPDGKVALLVKQGTVTELGEITSLLGGRGISFNSQGQVALTVKIANGPETLVLLTPATPYW